MVLLFSVFFFVYLPIEYHKKKRKKSDHAFMLGKVCYPRLYPTRFASANLKTIAFMIVNAPTFML
jgi:hypothetical protein